MKAKLMVGLALEAEADGLDTDATIPEEETPPADVPPEEDDDDIVDPVTDEDTSGDGDDEDGEGFDLDAPIVYPDLGNLNVDEVANVEHENAVAEETERKEASEEALSEAEQLVAAVESMCIAVRSTGALSPSMGQSGATMLMQTKAKLGYKDARVNFAKEDFAGDTPEKASKIALEDFRTVIRQIWEALIKSLTRAIEWLKKMFREFFYNVKKTKEATQALSNAVLKQRGDAKSKFWQLRAARVIDNNHYVFLPSYSTWLTHKGKQPGEYETNVYEDFRLKGKQKPSYPSAYMDILELAKKHVAYREAFGAQFVLNMNAMCKNIVEDANEDVPSELLNVAALMAPNAYGDNKIPGNAAELGYLYGINDGYLGDFIVTHLHDPRITPQSPLEDGLKALSEWKTELHFDRSVKHDGWLGFLTSEEIYETSKNVMAIENVLFDYEKTLDLLTHTQEQLKKMAAAATEATVANSKEYFTEGSKDGWKGNAMNLIIRAIDNTVTNINRSVFEQSSCIHTSCHAWNVYLQATYKEEKLMLEKA